MTDQDIKKSEKPAGAEVADSKAAEAKASEQASNKMLADQHGYKGHPVGAGQPNDSAAAVLPKVTLSDSESGATSKTATVERPIHQGDTLSKIASEALGAGASRRDIYNYVHQIARHNRIEDEDKIYAGRSLTLPEYHDPRQKQDSQRNDDQSQAKKNPDASADQGTDKGQVQPDKVDPSGTDKGQVQPDKVDPSGTDKGQVQPDKVDPSGTDKGQVQPDKVDPSGTDKGQDSAPVVDETPKSTLDKTLHVGGLAVDGAVEHVEEHPYLVAAEVVGGALVGGAIVATAPVWATAAAAIGGISYAGYEIYHKSKELLPALDTIYADHADKDDLAKAEKVVKHDLGVGLVDGVGIVIGGVGAKVITNKIVGKAGAVVAGEEGANEVAAEGAKEATKEATNEASKEATNEATKQATTETTKQATVEGGKDATVEGGKQATVEGGKQATVEGGKQATANAPKDQGTAGGDAQMDKTKVQDAPNVSMPEPVKNASSEWTGNKYKNTNGDFRQEDSHWVSPDGKVALVADGMGGHGAGDTASLITTDVFKARLATLPENASQEQAEAWLKESIEAAAERIKVAEADGSYTAADGTVHSTAKGMGSTIVASVKHEDKMLIAWAGDSRAYRMRDGKLEQLTQDHSWDNLAKEKLGMSDAEIAAADQGHVIMSSLGNHKLTIGQVAVDIKPGDRFLLASDGLERLSPQEIAGAFGPKSTPEEVSSQLIDAVKARFEEALKQAPDTVQDNTTVVVLEPPSIKPDLPNVADRINLPSIKPAAWHKFGIASGAVTGFEDLNDSYPQYLDIPALEQSGLSI